VAASARTESGRERLRLRATVEYDGTDFCGFQVQRSRAGQHAGQGAIRTVQGALEEALAQILQKPTSLLAAGRTDSGVHAVGQVIAFDAQWGRPIADLQRALNAVLPHDVAVRTLGLATPGFHPRYDAVSRTYCYAAWNRPLRSALSRRNTLWVRRPLDLAAMDEAAQLLVGSHDFCTFGTAPRSMRREDVQAPAGSATAAKRPSTVRSVIRAAWARVPAQQWDACLPTWQAALLGRAPTDGARRAESTCDAENARDVAWQGWIEFTIEANAFLYRMVRSIVGTLLQVGRGDLTVSQFASALGARDRSRAGPTAPPQGLCLIRVDYPNE
jgi:tRNA pseudouridine38-40 synthase